MIISREKTFDEMDIFEQCKLCKGICIIKEQIKTTSDEVVYYVKPGSVLHIDSIDFANKKDKYVFVASDSKGKSIKFTSRVDYVPFVFATNSTIQNLYQPNPFNLYQMARRFDQKEYDKKIDIAILSSIIAVLFTAIISIALVLINSETRTSINDFSVLHNIACWSSISMVDISSLIVFIKSMIDAKNIWKNHECRDELEKYFEQFDCIQIDAIFSFYENYENNIRELNVLLS